MATRSAAAVFVERVFLLSSRVVKTESNTVSSLFRDDFVKADLTHHDLIDVICDEF